MSSLISQRPSTLRRMPLAAPNPTARGAAALTVVMLLFFVLAMVAAYANRNLIYEQRVSRNNFAATSATAAAEAGIDWAIALLSGARIDGACVPINAGNAAVAPNNDFRSRYIVWQPNGSYTTNTWVDADGTVRPFHPSCVLSPAGWSCSCPTAGDPNLPFLAAPNTTFPVFRVRMFPEGNPGIITLQARGCANMGNTTDIANNPNHGRSCHIAVQDPPGVDGLADIEVKLGLVRAIPVPPVAALTAGDTVTMGAATSLTVVNADPKTGVTVHAGNNIVVDPAFLSLRGPAGSNADTKITSDAAMAAMNEAQFFLAVFGQDAAGYRRQPAAVRVDCAAGCNYANIQDEILFNPGRIIWVDGDIDLNVAATPGTDVQPLMLVATGTITISGDFQAKGFLYGRNIVWNDGDAVVQGAVMASRTFTGNAAVNIVYDAAIMQRISTAYGSFVRVPGSWRATRNQV